MGGHRSEFKKVLLKTSVISNKYSRNPKPTINHKSTSRPNCAIIPPPLDIKKHAPSNATLRISWKPSNSCKRYKKATFGTLEILVARSAAGFQVQPPCIFDCMIWQLVSQLVHFLLMHSSKNGTPKCFRHSKIAIPRPSEHFLAWFRHQSTSKKRCPIQRHPQNYLRTS